MTNPRVPAGVPAGGQFAPSEKQEADVSLDASTAQRRTLHGIEIPDGLMPVHRDGAADSGFVIERQYGNVTATLWQVASRRGRFQGHVLTRNGYDLLHSDDWYENLDSALLDVEHCTAGLNA